MFRFGSVHRPLPAVLAVGLAIACSSTEPKGPGAISVSATANAVDAFFEYGIAIDGGTPRRGFTGQTILFTQGGLSQGAHTVSLVDVPPPCTGDEQRSVNLAGDDTAAVIITINCPRSTGDLRVNVQTTGTEPDPNGYFLTFNGQAVDLIGPNGTIDLTFIPPGVYSIGLADVAANCTAPAAQQANITTGQLTTLNFTVTCGPVGVFRFVTSIAGADRDPDGLLVHVDGDIGTRIPYGATTNVRVATGSRSYALGDVQPNCAVTGPATGTRTFTGGDTLVVTISADCTTFATGTVGSVATDATGDTLNNAGNNPNVAHDVVTVRSRYAPGFLILVIRFGRTVTPYAQSNPGGLVGYVELDIDESSATGQPAFINEWGGSATQGVDFALLLHQMDSVSMTAVRVTIDDAFLAGRVRAVYNADSIVAYLPLNKLSDDGKLTVTATVGTSDRPTDLVPNTGQILLQPSVPMVALRSASVISLTGPEKAARSIDYRKAGIWKRKR